MVCINFDDLCCAAGNKCYFETASFVTNKNLTINVESIQST